MTYLRSIEFLALMANHDCYIVLEQAAPAGRLEKEIIAVVDINGRAIGLDTPGGLKSNRVELPRPIFDDFLRAGMIEQDRAEDADGRIFYRLTDAGRTCGRE
jgi:hypothetical protein